MVQQVLSTLKYDWNVLVEDESIFIYDSVLAKIRRWGIVKEKRPVVTAGRFSLQDNHLWRDHFWRVNNYLDNTRDLTVNLLLHTLRRLERSLINLSCLYNRGTQHRSKIVEEVHFCGET